MREVRAEKEPWWGLLSSWPWALHQSWSKQEQPEDLGVLLRAHSPLQLLLLHPSPIIPSQCTGIRCGDPLPCVIVHPAAPPSLCCPELLQTAPQNSPQGQAGMMRLELEVRLLAGLVGSALCFPAGGEGLCPAPHPGEPQAGVGAAEQQKCSCLPGWVSVGALQGSGEQECMLLLPTSTEPFPRLSKSVGLQWLLQRGQPLPLHMSCSTSHGLRRPFLTYLVL